MKNNINNLYRVWDKKSKSYDTGALTLTKVNCEENYYSVEAFSKKYVIEQCTGKKDKFNKPIFENDIVKATEISDIDGDLSLLKEPIYLLVARNSDVDGFYLYGDDDDLSEDIYTIDLEKTIVVGNKNENKDLLKKIDLSEYNDDHPLEAVANIFKR